MSPLGPAASAAVTAAAAVIGHSSCQCQALDMRKRIPSSIARADIKSRICQPPLTDFPQGCRSSLLLPKSSRNRDRLEDFCFANFSGSCVCVWKCACVWEGSGAHRGRRACRPRRSCHQDPAGPAGPARTPPAPRRSLRASHGGRGDSSSSCKECGEVLIALRW